MVEIRHLIAEQRRARRGRLAVAAAAGAVVTVASIVLLGLSGWFITGAALAGLGGLAVAHTFNVLLPSAAIRLLAILRTGSRYAERVSGHEAALKALAALRPILFEDMASAPPERVFALSSGEAAARLVQDVDAIQTLFVRLSGPWAAAAGAAAAIGLTALAGWKAAAVVAVGLAVSVGGSLLIGRRRVDPAGRETQIAVGHLKDRLSALQGSAPELRAYGLEAWAVAEADVAARGLDRASARAALGAGWMSAWQILIVGGMVAGVVAVCAGRPAALVALAALAAVASAEVAGGLTGHFRSAGGARQALMRLADLVAGGGQRQTAAPRIGAEDELGLQAIGLTLSPPDRLAVIGATGSGKTSLIERLMGLRPCPDGSLVIAGSPPRHLDDRVVRSRFAYAAQDIRLLAGTVRTNLGLADPHADDEALWAALEDAALADRIRCSPQGLDMPLGENGTRLSGGERRRLGLARAYLRAAPWLVLDEPTEGLDALTESQVLDRLHRRLARTGQGLILISHRSAPIDLCDTTIIVSGIDAGGTLALQTVRRRPQAA